jgi:hypothetical protein
MLEQYRGYWISGKAGLVHPFSPESYPAGQIYKLAHAGSIEEVTRFALRSFKMTDALFSRVLCAGALQELCRNVVDECVTAQPRTGRPRGRTQFMPRRGRDRRSVQ